MIRFRPLLPLRDSSGVLAIESAVVAPVLVLMALGVFQVGSMVSRQQELQSGASDVTAIILAAANGPGTNSDDIKTIIKSSLNLTDSQVTLQQKYRCDSATALTDDPASCGTGAQVSEYVLLQLTDIYTPLWAKYGVGAPFTYTVNRTIQIK